MYDKSFYIIWVLFIIISGCSDDDRIINVNPPHGIPDSTFQVLGVSHDSVRIGEKLIARINNLIGAELASVHLNNVYLQHRTISDSIISVFIPHHSQSGQLRFKYFGTKDTIIYSENIIITDSCSTSLCVDWNSGERITELDSKVKTWDDLVTWNCKFSGDTTFFNISGLCGDECSFSRTLTFVTNEDNHLPQFVFAALQVQDPMGGPNYSDTLKQGIVRIDSWSKQNILSGTYTFNDYSWIFWFKNN